MARKECRTAREFGDLFRAEVSRLGSGWQWKRDLRPWLAAVFGGAQFGHPDFDWSPAAAQDLAREFVAEASTW